jgi:hypothetical protein
MKGQYFTASATLIGSLFAIAGSMAAQTRLPVPVPNTPKNLTYKSLRAVQYCEVWLFHKTPQGGTMDHITLPVGSVIQFNGLKTRWMGQGELPPGVELKPGEATYKAVQSHRKSSMTFERGKPVFILDDPDGVAWVMQSYSGIADRTLTYDSLKDLGGKLKTPDGWKYRVVTLDKDLVISTPGGFAWIT